MAKGKSLQRAGISTTKGVSRMDYIADDFAISDDAGTFRLFDVPTRTSDLAFGICRKGTIEAEIDLKRHVFKASQLIAIFPEQVIRFINKSDDFSVGFVIMSDRFLNNSRVRLKQRLPLLFHIKKYPCIDLTNEQVATITEYLSLLRKRIRAGSQAHLEDITRLLMLALFYEGSEMFEKYLPESQVELSRKEEIFETFTRLVSQHYARERSVEFYADKMCVTPKHLSAVVKDVSGRIASRWIDDYVALEAKVLLKSTDMTVLEISDKLNFDTQSRFGTYFKRIAGVSPSEYRKN